MKYAAVTIETRCLESFPETVRAHMQHLPGWDLVIYGSNQNEDFLNQHIKDFILHKVHFPTFGQFEYNLTLTNPKFWEPLLEYDRVLIFQYDSMILRDGIEEFVKWDYVGAPWKFQKHGGNGGLSLRCPKTMLNLCMNHEWDQRLGNEDVWFSNLMYQFQISLSKFNCPCHYNPAPREVCEKFSVESIFQLGTFGFHAIDAWLTPEQCEQIRIQYQKNIVPTPIS